MIAQCEKCGTVHADTELHGCHCHCGGVIYLRNAVKAPAGNTVVDSAELEELKNDRRRFEFLMFVMSRPDSIVTRDSVDAAIAERNEPTRAADPKQIS